LRKIAVYFSRRCKLEVEGLSVSKLEKKPKFHLRMKIEEQEGRIYRDYPDKFISFLRESSAILTLSGNCILLRLIIVFLCGVNN